MSHIGRFGQISRSIAVAHEKAKPKNTKTAYRPKITEYLQFCNSLYSKDAHPTHVTEEKAYGFISYQAHRKKYSTKKRKSTTDSTVQRFDRADYDKVVELIGTFNHDDDNWNHFGDVLDFDAVNQYLCAVKSLMREQRDEGLVKLKNEDLMSERMKLLLLLVTERKEKVRKGKFYLFTLYLILLRK